MPSKHFISFLFIFFVGVSIVFGQEDSAVNPEDTLNTDLYHDVVSRLKEAENQKLYDSLRRTELEEQILQLKSSDKMERKVLEKQLLDLKAKEEKVRLDKQRQVDSLMNNAIGYPVMGVERDTVAMVYFRTGALTPGERAKLISDKIKDLYHNDFFKEDSLKVVAAENAYDIIYESTILMSVSEMDAIWYKQSSKELALHISDNIKTSVQTAKSENKIGKVALRFGLVILVVLIAWLAIWLIGKGYARLLRFVVNKKDDWLKDLSYRDYTFLTKEHELTVVYFLIKVFRWFIYIVLLYITLPIVFSIFPFSRQWADALFQLVWAPFKNVLLAIWDYLPNLISIMVILFVMKYVTQAVKYIFQEIHKEKLRISGFHADWAIPTYSIVRFLLIAFTFVLIFPQLPGSDSPIFKGMSVFVGVLFSLGSSSAIANMIAGLVITYMRPFKIGDRIKIGDVSGDVVEKTLLVTRIKTIKNEMITIPNSSVLTGNTTNYTREAQENGLILHTTVTIGYDVPWPKVHQALVDAALKTDMIMNSPRPFVLQTSLDDFYVSYQINAYTREASKQALIYSVLHQNIQDVFNEEGIEIMSPHYLAARDGNQSTIPAQYLPNQYSPQGFNLSIKSTENNKI